MDERCIELIRSAVYLQAELIAKAAHIEEFFGDMYIGDILTEIFGFTWTLEDAMRFTDAEICEWFAKFEKFRPNVLNAPLGRPSRRANCDD